MNLSSTGPAAHEAGSSGDQHVTTNIRLLKYGFGASKRRRRAQHDHQKFGRIQDPLHGRKQGFQKGHCSGASRPSLCNIHCTGY